MAQRETHLVCETRPTYLDAPLFIKRRIHTRPPALEQGMFWCGSAESDAMFARVAPLAKMESDPAAFPHLEFQCGYRPR